MLEAALDGGEVRPQERGSLVTSAISTAWRRHWPEFLIEGTGLGLFMISAIGFTIVLEHPDSPVRAAIHEAFARRALMGLAMGGTLILLIHNPFGRRSGAHFNPAFTFTYWRLGKISGADAFFYGCAQFLGALAGVAAISLAWPDLAADAHVRHAITSPGPWGLPAAFGGEVLIAFTQMSVVLFASNNERLRAWTGRFAAFGVALYIAFEAPLSGMSMNPARSLGSAVAEARLTDLWIYFSAPLAGMALAAELYVARTGLRRVHCGKLDHSGSGPCLFRCTPLEDRRDIRLRRGVEHGTC